MTRHPRFEIRTARNGLPYVVLLGGNGNEVWTTKPYRTNRAFKRAISIARTSVLGPVIDRRKKRGRG